MVKNLFVFVGLIFLFVLNTSVFADPPAAEEAAEEAVAPPTSQTTVPTAAAPVTQQAVEPTSGSDDRNEGIATRLRELVKRIDIADRVGKQFPFKNVETAIRAEFMRRTEGNTSISWLPKKKLRDTDMNVAQDNLELFITYAEKLAALTKGNKKRTKKEEDEMKLLAAKMVVDAYNVGTEKSGMRGLASMGGPSGLSPTGKGELARRRRLTGGLVSGEDYKPLGAKKVDDIGKAYKAVLQGAVKDYEGMAVAINKQPMNDGGGKKKRKNG